MEGALLFTRTKYLLLFTACVKVPTHTICKKKNNKVEYMLGNNECKLQGIGQLFVLEKLLTKSEAVTYCKHAAAEKISLPQYLVKNNILSATEIAHVTAQSFGVPIMDMDRVDVHNLPIALVSEQLMLRHSIVPLFRQGMHLYLATEDPSNQDALKEIQFHTGLIPHPIVVETNKLARIIEHLSTVKDNQELSEYKAELPAGTDDDHDLKTDYSGADDAPVVKFVNKILLKAIKQGASDIHFEPFEKAYRIRFRHDGILHERFTPPLDLSARIAARIKVLSNLDISERRIPQDGSFKINLSNNQSVDFRVSTCPTVGGEKIVVRILDSFNSRLTIESLGLNTAQHEQFIRAIKRPQGMILVTGPTGSGKTVSLYAALNLLNTTDINISTAEDPVEIKIHGINQVNINPKAGLTFSTALRSFLRQDPDAIMVGEIRDLETAEIAIKAAQTGHLVLSTLHTNSAAETLTRLLNMGIPAFNIASAITLIVAQRLVRVLCNQCKTIPSEIHKPNLSRLGFQQAGLNHAQIFQAVGCTQCKNGYQGRIGLFEVLPISKTLEQLIMAGANSLAVQEMAQHEGMMTIYQSGLEKVKQGITTLEEVNRVTVD